MSFFAPIIAGVVLILVGFVAAKVYHERWLGGRDWTGNVFDAWSRSSGKRFDRAIGWLPYIGLLLIASAVLWGFMGFVLSLSS
jgi:xanthine/uracil permease